jgi:hypothetical protein
MNTYDKPVFVSYRLPTVTLSGGAATVGRFIGPKLRKGYLRALTYIITTSVTVAAAVLNIGTAGVYGTVTVPVAAANAGGSATKAALKAASEIPADTVISVLTDGAATAGAATFDITIGWA